MKTDIHVGQSAPDFTLMSQNGEPVSLADFKSKPVVLFFFPKSGSPVCTAESCSFRDNYEAFQEVGAEVIGISSDTSETQRNFATNHRLPFVLLSDEKGDVRKRYGVPATLGIIPGRATYVIDQQGVIQHIFNSSFNPKAHIKEALRILQIMMNYDYHRGLLKNLFFLLVLGLLH